MLSYVDGDIIGTETRC